eukprot:g4803.t1
MPPKGSWIPSLNIGTLLTTVRLLLSEPNADDGLMPEITELYQRNLARFEQVARTHTEKHAIVDKEEIKPERDTCSNSSSSSDYSSEYSSGEDGEEEDEKENEIQNPPKKKRKI